MMVLAQTYYHPWTASVDGRRTKIWKANHAFQCFEVPAGRHEVRLAYEDWTYYVGAVISGITLLGCLAGLVLFNKRLPDGWFRFWKSEQGLRAAAVSIENSPEKRLVSWTLPISSPDPL